MEKHYSDEEVQAFVKEFAPGMGFKIAPIKTGGQLYQMGVAVSMDHAVPADIVGTEVALDHALQMMTELQRTSEIFLGLEAFSREKERGAMVQILDLIDQPDTSVSKLRYLVSGLIDDFDVESTHLAATCASEVLTAKLNGDAS